MSEQQQAKVGQQPAIEITLRQAEELVKFFGGHDLEVTVMQRPATWANMPDGLYAYCSEYPEEGAHYLGVTEVGDDLAMNGRKDTGTPIHEQNARHAIDCAIDYGRQGIAAPPTDDHWLMPYWKIGQQLAELARAQAETDHLLSSPANAAHLARSIEQARNGQVQERQLVEVDESAAPRAALSSNPEAVSSEPVPVSSKPSAAQEPTSKLGYALGMRVLQSDLYRLLDDAERAECDEFIARGMKAPSAEPGDAQTAEVMRILADHGIGMCDGETVYPHEGEDAAQYMGAIRAILARFAAAPAAPSGAQEDTK